MQRKRREEDSLVNTDEGGNPLISDYEVEAALQRGMTEQEALQKVVNLEITEQHRVDKFKELLDAEAIKDFPFETFLPTRDFGHGKTSPLDEFKANSDYEIAIHLINLNSKKFAKAAIFYFMMALQDVNITRSRGGFLVKEIRTSWAGRRKTDKEDDNWFVDPRKMFGKGKG